jgi:hypothetical protein
MTNAVAYPTNTSSYVTVPIPQVIAAARYVEWWSVLVEARVCLAAGEHFSLSTLDFEFTPGRVVADVDGDRLDQIRF